MEAVTKGTTHSREIKQGKSCYYHTDFSSLMRTEIRIQQAEGSVEGEEIETTSIY